MTAPAGFLDVTAEDGLAILAAVSEIAMVRQAGPTVGQAASIIYFRSGEFVAIATEFGSIVERISKALEKDGE